MLFWVGLPHILSIMEGMDAPPHILVVEDDRETRELVGRVLRKDGYRVSTAQHGREMRRRLKEAPVDLVVLDLMLPKEDGLTLCRELRAGGGTVPVIMLTAKTNEADRVRGLETGADDYLSKPFNSRELLARIKALLRRVRNPREPAGEPTAVAYRFGGWRLDAAKRELETADGTLVPLSTAECGMLLAFVRHPQRVLAREELLDLIGGGAGSPSDRKIDIQVSRLRRKLKEDGSNPDIIRTVWGGGYLFTLPVAAETTA
jgi:two-component system, OmpR family, response regulator